MQHDALQMRVRQIENWMSSILTCDISQMSSHVKKKLKTRTTRFAFDPITFDPPFSSTQADAEENAFLRRESVNPSARSGQIAPPETYKQTDP